MWECTVSLLTLWECFIPLTLGMHCLSSLSQSALFHFSLSASAPLLTLWECTVSPHSLRVHCLTPYFLRVHHSSLSWSALSLLTLWECTTPTPYSLRVHHSSLSGSALPPPHSPRAHCARSETEANLFCLETKGSVCFACNTLKRSNRFHLRENMGKRKLSEKIRRGTQ